MTLSAAVREAYAGSDGGEGVMVWSAEIDHPTFDAPVYIVSGMEGDPAVEPELRTVTLPLGGSGGAVAHLPLPFEISPPGFDDEGPTDARIRISGVATDVFEPLLRNAVGTAAPITIGLRAYLVVTGQTISGPDDDTLSQGLLLRDITLSEDALEGSLAWPDGRQVSVPTGPNAFFERDSYPGLF